MQHIHTKCPAPVLNITVHSTGPSFIKQNKKCLKNECRYMHEKLKQPFSIV
jgi:hypothetical protein